MTSDKEFTPEQLAKMEQVQKLLNLAGKAGTVAEAEAAAGKAQELMEQYNLDAAAVADLAKVKEGRREEMMVDGGFYAFHRELWTEVARLNFCLYWNQKYVSDEVWKGKRVEKRRHAVIGRAVNVRMTVAMASYLQQAIERILGEHLHGDADMKLGNSLTNYAFSYRKGAARTIIGKLRERRAERLETEKRETAQQEVDAAVAAAAADPGNPVTVGAVPGRALTLSAYSKSEEEANLDFRFGEGYSAKKAAERAAEAKLAVDMRAAYTRWAAANPKAAQRDFRYRDEATGQTWVYGRSSGGGGGLGSRGGSTGIDHGAYQAGRADAQAVSLEQQADHQRKKGLSHG